MEQEIFKLWQYVCIPIIIHLWYSQWFAINLQVQRRQIKINEETTSTRGGYEICLAENSESYWPSSHQQSQGTFDNIIYEVFYF